MLSAIVAIFAITAAVRGSEIQVRTRGTRPIHLSSIPNFDPGNRLVFSKHIVSTNAFDSSPKFQIIEKNHQERFQRSPLPDNLSPETYDVQSSRFYQHMGDSLDPVCFSIPSFHFPLAVRILAKSKNVVLPRLSLTWRPVSAKTELSLDRVVRVYEKHLIPSTVSNIRPAWMASTARYNLIQTYELVLTAVGLERFGNLIRFLHEPQDLLMELGWRVTHSDLMAASIEELAYVQAQALLIERDDKKED